MKPVIQYVVIGILLAVILYLILRPDPVHVTLETRVGPHLDTVAILRHQVDSITARQRADREAARVDSLKQVRVRSDLKARIRGLEKTLALTRPEVQSVMDSLPKLASFVNLQDSLLETKGIAIDTLENQLWRNAIRCAKERKQAQDKWELEHETALHLNQVIGEYQKADRKHRKQKNGLKIAAGAGLVVGFLIGN